eukprot:16426943-Heterocapsa_arctica.AAC.1
METQRLVEEDPSLRFKGGGGPIAALQRWRRTPRYVSNMTSNCIIIFTLNIEREALPSAGFGSLWKSPESSAKS